MNVCSSCPDGQLFMSTGDGSVQCAASCPDNSPNCTTCSPTEGFVLVDNNFSCGGNMSNISGNNIIAIGGTSDGAP